jgi:hypothetical protein
MLEQPLLVLPTEGQEATDGGQGEPPMSNMGETGDRLYMYRKGDWMEWGEHRMGYWLRGEGRISSFLALGDEGVLWSVVKGDV